jgi:Acyl-CoA reductase (LuxC)
MMTLSERIDALAMLGDYLHSAPPEELEQVAYQAWADNKWFSSEHVLLALESVATQMLDKQKLVHWAQHYQLPEESSITQVVALIMAGNIPLVGFSDWLAVFVSGQRALVKLSDKDKVLLPFLIHKMAEWAPESRAYTHMVGETERLAGFDAVIATGSNNTARYFEQYFGKYKHIIRKNRNSVAVLTGQESPDELRGLADDIFYYYGLGCRNVSKIYVPLETDMQALVDALDHYPLYADHNKYRNNYDYNTTLYILNKMPFVANNSLILREEEPIQSRISTVNYAFYQDQELLQQELLDQKEQIQCVVTHAQLSDKLPLVAFGHTQKPTLFEYPDGVDVMAWLSART